MIGQERVVESLRVATEAARLEDRAVDHILLTGPQGLGKSTLARAVSVEMAGRDWITSGPALGNPFALVSLLSSVQEKEIVFIDEIHALPRKVAEMLYEAMEDGTLSLPVGLGLRARTITLKLPAFTVIGATTDPELLPRPLLSRFSLHGELESYDLEELERIAVRAARSMGLDLTEDASRMLARASNGTPRLVLRLTRRLRDLCRAGTAGGAHARTRCTAEGAARLEADASAVREVLPQEGLDEPGLGPSHRRVLEVLETHKKPIGGRRLAALAGIGRRTFRELIEPELLRLGRVIPTPRGLMILPVR
jgi:Holliday junction DNA helicase RuvB